MLFWAIATAMTAAVTLLAAWPLLRGRPASAAPRAAHDAEVFRAQLRELDADLDRGTLSAEDAASARAEIGRRLLKATGEGRDTRAVEASRWRIFAASVLTLVLVPALSLAVYLSYGRPGLPDLPLLARAQPAPDGAAEAETLIAGAEARLAADPEDGRGWDVLAPVYLRLQRPQDAANAFRNASRLLGATAPREAGLGEALTYLAGGEVTDEARAAFERALQLDPAFMPARFFLALDLSQERRFAEAKTAWQGVIEASPPEAPWLPVAHAALADATQTLAAARQPGPSDEAVAAAAALPDESRQAMIEGMVSQLAERLKSAPNDLEGWKRLIRSYGVLGRPERAREAFASASAAFPEGSAEKRDLAAFARSVGIETGEGGSQP